MPKRSADDYVSDDGFVADGSASPPLHTKKPKIQGEASSGGTERKVKKGKGGLSEAQRDDNGDEFWELSNSRRVTLNEFKGKTLINVREYYESNGKQLPGKKGISMPVDQFSALIHVLPQIERALKEKGVAIPRPLYGDATMTATEQPKKKSARAKDERQNFEATSDEDEDKNGHED